MFTQIKHFPESSKCFLPPVPNNYSSIGEVAYLTGALINKYVFLRFNVCTGHLLLGSHICSLSFPCSALWRAHLCMLHFPASLAHWFPLRLDQWAALVETGGWEAGRSPPHCTSGGASPSSPIVPAPGMVPAPTRPSPRFQLLCVEHLDPHVLPLLTLLP